MAHQHFSPAKGGIAVLCVSGLAVASGAVAHLEDDLLRAADAGECIENVAYRMIEQRGPDSAAGVVAAALRALAARVEQQRALGCNGDIAAQAIAAGADPDDVLEASAAGL